MKFNFTVDCTADEARAFLGLPDVAPMQQAMMAELESRLRKTMDAMQPEAIMKTWMPAGLQHVEQAQQLFWQNLQQTMTGIASTTSDALGGFARKTGTTKAE